MKLLVSVGVLILASAAIPSHEIKSLPGWDAPLKSKQFSGLIATGNETGVPGKLHYWLIEAEEEPDKAPLVMWYNGE